MADDHFAAWDASWDVDDDLPNQFLDDEADEHFASVGSALRRFIGLSFELLVAVCRFGIKLALYMPRILLQLAFSVGSSPAMQSAARVADVTLVWLLPFYFFMSPLHAATFFDRLHEWPVVLLFVHSSDENQHTCTNSLIFISRSIISPVALP